MDEREARMVLSCVVHPADIRAAKLVEEYGAVDVWNALRQGRPERWAEKAKALDLAQVTKLASRHEIRFVIPGDPQWPVALEDLSWTEPLAGRGHQPLGLWARGPRDVNQCVGRSVSIVGARAATNYGAAVAADMAADLAAEGIGIVSGGAYGIDAAAHRGAVRHCGGTVAVLACGLDRLYPTGNASLLRHIADNHVLLSECPPGASVTKVGFLARNRLIACLSKGTVIVEAAVRSGARNTANWATRLGRILMAVPGSVLSAASVTPHRLIADGEATLVSSAQDIVGLIDSLYEIGGTPAASNPQTAWDNLTPTQRSILDAFPATATRSAAQISVTSAVTYPECLAGLSELLDQQLIESIGRDKWRLSRSSPDTRRSA